MRASTRGAALIDVVVSCAVFAIVSAIAIPMMQATRDRDTSRMAARHLAHRLQMLRLEALRRNRVVAMRFDPTDLGRVGSYVDGDGDGVLQRDIDRGVDPPIDSETRLTNYFATVSLRVAAAVPSPDGTGIVPAGSDPVRIGNTDLLSFSPLGTATAGSIYLVGPSGPQMCVRVLGTTGRVRVMWFDAASGMWQQD